MRISDWSSDVCSSDLAVDGADVLQAEVLEQSLRCEGVLDPLLHRVQRVIGGRADAGNRVEPALDLVEHLLVARVGPQGGARGGQAADGRRVGTLVVVDHDHQATVVGDRDVVMRLPRHPPGPRPVADPAYHEASLTLYREGHAHPTSL